MLTDCISFICLICALACIMTISFNKCGYQFTRMDTALLCLCGVVAFVVPYGIVILFASLL